MRRSHGRMRKHKSAHRRRTAAHRRQPHKRRRRGFPRRRRGRHIPLKVLESRYRRLEQILASRMARGER